MKIYHIAITVNDLVESQEFYQKFFGFKIFKSFGRPDLGAKAVLLELKGFFIELWQFDDMRENSDDLQNIKIRGLRHVAFEVEDLEKIISIFKENNHPITEPKIGASGYRYVFTYDPNGVAIEFCQKII